MKRVWTYEKNSWEPSHWWNACGVPAFHMTDEYGRKTMVWGFWFIGYLVVAYKTCRCEDCVDTRTFQHLKEQYGDDFAEDWFDYQIRMRGVSGSGTPRV